MKFKRSVLLILFLMGLASQNVFAQKPLGSEDGEQICFGRDVEVEIVLTWYDPALCYKIPTNCSGTWYMLGTGMNLLKDCGSKSDPKDCYGKTISCPVNLSKNVWDDPRGFTPYFTEMSIPFVSQERQACADSGGSIVFLRPKKDGTPRFHVDVLWNTAKNGRPRWNKKIVPGTVHLESKHVNDKKLLRLLDVKPACIDARLGGNLR